MFSCPTAAARYHHRQWRRRDARATRRVLVDFDAPDSPPGKEYRRARRRPHAPRWLQKQRRGAAPTQPGTHRQPQINFRRVHPLPPAAAQRIGPSDSASPGPDPSDFKFVRTYRNKRLRVWKKSAANQESLAHAPRPERPTLVRSASRKSHSRAMHALHGNTMDSRSNPATPPPAITPTSPQTDTPTGRRPPRRLLANDMGPDAPADPPQQCTPRAQPPTQPTNDIPHSQPGASSLGVATAPPSPAGVVPAEQPDTAGPSSGTIAAGSAQRCGRNDDGSSVDFTPASAGSDSELAAGMQSLAIHSQRCCTSTARADSNSPQTLTTGSSPIHPPASPPTAAVIGTHGPSPQPNNGDVGSTLPAVVMAVIQTNRAQAQERKVMKAEDVRSHHHEQALARIRANRAAALDRKHMLSEDAAAHAVEDAYRRIEANRAAAQSRKRQLETQRARQVRARLGGLQTATDGAPPGWSPPDVPAAPRDFLRDPVPEASLGRSMVVNRDGVCRCDTF